MIDDGTYTAVLDRFEDDLAVLLVEGDDEVIGELVFDDTALPADGRHVDAVFTIEIVDGDLVDADYRPEESVERKEEAQSRFDRLSERPPADDNE